jgi:hypothetical protein
VLRCPYSAACRVDSHRKNESAHTGSCGCKKYVLPDPASTLKNRPSRSCMTPPPSACGSSLHPTSTEILIIPNKVLICLSIPNVFTSRGSVVRAYFFDLYSSSFSIVFLNPTFPAMW